ncbi:hypothetical protein P3S68_020545 [Capsicum galapagoense]
MELVETSTRKSNIEGIDRISSLPDDVLHKILSSLYIFDVVKLSVFGDAFVLKLLHLENVKLSDEHFTGCFFSQCPLLESLILHECSLGAITLIDIASTSLIHVTILLHEYTYLEGCENCEFKISFPNLKFLTYEAPMPKDIIMENLFSIEDVRIIFTNICSLEDTVIFVHKMIKEVASTSVLTLCNALILGMCKATSKESLSPVSFCKLKTLKLGSTIVVSREQKPVKLAQELTSLNVDNCNGLADNEGSTKNWHMHYPDEIIVCLESHLKSICLSNFNGEENEIELLRFFLKNARVLEKLKVFWARNLFWEESYLNSEISLEEDEYNAYLAEYAYLAKYAYLAEYAGKRKEIPEKGMYKATTKERLSPISFYKLKTIKLYVRVDGDSMQAMILLLKHSPNLEVLQLWSRLGESRIENWQIHDLDESIVCLESHLKSIRLTDFEGEENEIELLSFFSEECRGIRKIDDFLG